MKRIKLSICLVIFGCSLFSTPRFCLADTLVDFMRSREYQIYQRRGKDRQVNGAKYLPAGSNIARLFTEYHGSSLLLDWLGVSAAGPMLGKVDLIKKHEYVGATRKLVTDKLTKVSLIVLMPHPKFRQTVEAGLIDAFSELKPPKLKITYSEEVLVKNITATMYEKEAGGCSLYIPLSGSGVVSASIETCSAKKELLALIAKFDFERLNSKIES